MRVSRSRSFPAERPRRSPSAPPPLLSRRPCAGRVLASSRNVACPGPRQPASSVRSTWSLRHFAVLRDPWQCPRPFARIPPREKRRTGSSSSRTSSMRTFSLTGPPTCRRASSERCRSRRSPTFRRRRRHALVRADSLLRSRARPQKGRGPFRVDGVAVVAVEDVVELRSGLEGVLSLSSLWWSKMWSCSIAASKRTFPPPKGDRCHST